MSLRASLPGEEPLTTLLLQCCSPVKHVCPCSSFDLHFVASLLLSLNCWLDLFADVRDEHVAMAFS